MGLFGIGGGGGLFGTGLGGGVWEDMAKGRKPSDLSSLRVTAPKATPEEKEYRGQQKSLLESLQGMEGQLNPFMLQTMGIMQNPDGSYRYATNEEQMAGADPQTAQALSLLSAYGGNIEDIMSGNYSNPILEASLAKSEGMLGEQLARQLGPEWAQSTSGIQQANTFANQAGLARYGAAMDALNNYAGLYGGQQGLLSGLQQQNLGNIGAMYQPKMSLFDMLASAQNPYTQDRALTVDAAKAQSASRAQENSAYMNSVANAIPF